MTDETQGVKAAPKLKSHLINKNSFKLKSQVKLGWNLMLNDQ